VHHQAYDLVSSHHFSFVQRVVGLIWMEHIPSLMHSKYEWRSMGLGIYIERLGWKTNG